MFIGVLRKNGILNHRPYRNPIMCEKTPRDDTDWSDLHPPKATIHPPASKQWKDAERDFGLLGKFTSQKESYSEQILKEDVMEAARKKMVDRNKNPTIYPTNNDNDLQPNNSNSNNNKQKPMIPEFNANLSKNNINNHNNHHSTTTMKNHKKHEENEKKKQWNEYRTTLLKKIGTEHPEVMSQYRADRAVTYINKLNHPNDIDHNDLIDLNQDKSFKPSGISPYKTFDSARNWTKSLKNKNTTHELLATNISNNNNNNNNHSNTKDIDELNHLIRELNQTEDSIEKQKLKINLNQPKVRRYDRQLKHETGNDDDDYYKIDTRRSKIVH